MGMFRGMNDADPAGTRNPYFLEGKYVVRIVSCATIASRLNVPFFIVESEIMESTNEELPVGVTVSTLYNLQKDMGLPNVKRFIGVANGLTDPEEIKEQVTEEVAELTVSEEQPLTGVILRVNARKHVTKKGDEIVVVDWMPYEN